MASSEARSLHSASNPLAAFMNPAPSLSMEAPQQQQTASVNRSVANNEAAGNSNVDAMATQPAGFNLYTQLTLKDTAFYKPYEVYKGQTTVDNARALRQLSSDRIHREMVEQQYNRKGN